MLNRTFLLTRASALDYCLVMAITPKEIKTMDWTYYTMRNDGFLYDDDGNRETFDGRPRFAASEWEAYLEENDIRGTVR